MKPVAYYNKIESCNVRLQHQEITGRHILLLYVTRKDKFLTVWEGVDVPTLSTYSKSYPQVNDSYSGVACNVILKGLVE